MKRKIITLFLVISCIFLLGGCATKDAKRFKSEYEGLNNQTNSSGKEHRSVTIDEENPIVYISDEDVVKMMDNKETFYVYFGDKLCPWCRSVIEELINKAKEHNIVKLYYVPIWDENGSEVIRDKYKLNEDNKVELVSEGSKSYKTLLEKFDSVLDDYTLTDSKGNNILVGEKRIYAPNIFYIKDGNVVKLTSATSSLQTDSREELTDEIKNDMKSILDDFFKEEK